MKSSEKQYSASFGGHSTMFYFADGSDSECRRSIKLSIKSRNEKNLPIEIERIY